MRTPSSALPAWPNGLVEGFGTPLPFFLATSFTTLLDFAAAFFAVLRADFAAFFCFFAMCCLPLSPLMPAKAGIQFLASGSPLSRGRAAGESLLLQLALRVEVADAAAFAAGRRIDHRIDQRRLAAVHRGIDGALEL